MFRPFKNLPSIRQMRSENWGGVASVTGDALAALIGDIESLTAMALFFSAEYAMTRHGHTARGYSLAHALFAPGNFLLAISASKNGQTGLKWTLAALGVTLAIGAVRYPAEKLAEFCERHKSKITRPLTKLAQTIQPSVGWACLGLRAPGLISAIMERRLVMIGIFSLWMTADILCGRLQDKLPIRQRNRDASMNLKP
jgi:hypothetical protein